MNSVDVIFLSFDEANAEENWQRLLTAAPGAKRVSGIEGIFNAHLRCAEAAATDSFYIVDGDSWILDGFRFEPPSPHADPNASFVFLAKNAVTDEIHPNGGVKLVRRAAVGTMRRDAVDIFSSVGGSRRLVRRLASETRFSSTPFLAWRGGFRECAKHAGGIVPFPEKAVNRTLLAWQTRGVDRMNGSYSMQGAREGAAYGLRNRGDVKKLSKINSIPWLESRFGRHEGLHGATAEITLLSVSPAH